MAKGFSIAEYVFMPLMIEISPYLELFNKDFVIQDKINRLFYWDLTRNTLKNNLLLSTIQRMVVHRNSKCVSK